ncbi:hypothetical protein HD806DRAFT_108129 [Xylariaceae sp. AK1471]|nr:hypothetical protein HD806DRAFT_108129 [Xylariaceae sp. AK1471]
MSLINVTSSAFLYCPPVTQTLFTTVYETVLPAACETGSWLATYTVTETCPGNPANYVTPTIPPGFVVTTVSCGVCAEKEIEITCPGAQPTGMGMATVQIGGNGVTATIVASPAPAPGSGGSPAAPAAPTGGATSGGATSGGASSGGASSGGASSGGASSGGAASGGAIPPVEEGNMGGMGGNTGGVASNGTNMTPAVTPGVAVTAGATSLKRSLAIGAGLAFVAGPIFLL